MSGRRSGPDPGAETHTAIRAHFSETTRRIMVADVLHQVVSSMAWEAILEESRGTVSQEGFATRLLKERSF